MHIVDTDCCTSLPLPPIDGRGIAGAPRCVQRVRGPCALCSAWGCDVSCDGVGHWLRVSSSYFIFYVHRDIPCSPCIIDTVYLWFIYTESIYLKQERKEVMFSLTDSLTGGIDFALAGNGGPDCVAFIDGSRRVWETCLALIVCLVTIAGGYANLTPPKEYVAVHKDRGGKRVLLIVLSLVWGIEIGFKFATQSLIFLLNPCHVTTAIQVGFSRGFSLLIKLFADLLLVSPDLPFGGSTYSLDHLVVQGAHEFFERCYLGYTVPRHQHEAGELPFSLGNCTLRLVSLTFITFMLTLCFISQLSTAVFRK